MAHQVTRLFESNLHRPHSPLPSPEWPGQRPPNSALGFLPSEGAPLFSYKLQRRLGGVFVKMVPSVLCCDPRSPAVSDLLRTEI